MIVEIVTTGTELLLGQIINTNAPYLGRQLNRLGLDVLYQSTVGDNRERMEEVLLRAMERADLVITSGGLGPTQGDITKEVTAKICGRTLYLHEDSKQKLQCFFAERHAAMPENNLRQAMIPQGALILKNERGTAPGVVLEHNGKTIINLPGPPHELEFMFEHHVVPYLTSKYGMQGAIVSRVLHTYGIGESALEEIIKDLIAVQNNPTIALLARRGEVVVRLTAKAPDEQMAADMIDQLQQVIAPRLGRHLFGIDDDTMERVVGQKLLTARMSIALAESCTGGLISSRLTDIPGSSEYLQGSVVCYSNQAKVDHVGVSQSILQRDGAVSEQTALAMASGIRQKFSTHVGVGITGIAGPDGATSQKPVGLVYIAIDGPDGAKCYQCNFYGQRVDIKFAASQRALDVIRQYLIDLHSL